MLGSPTSCVALVSRGLHRLLPAFYVDYLICLPGPFKLLRPSY